MVFHNHDEPVSPSEIRLVLHSDVANLNPTVLETHIREILNQERPILVNAEHTTIIETLASRIYAIAHNAYHTGRDAPPTERAAMLEDALDEIMTLCEQNGGNDAARISSLG